MPSAPPKNSLPALPGSGPLPDEIELGRVSGMFGYRGEVRLYLHNPESDAFARPCRVVLLAPDGRRFRATLSARSGAGKRILGRIPGVSDRDAAAALINYAVLVRKADLPVPEPGTLYVHEIIGLPVFMGEQLVGTVAGVHSTLGGDLLEVHTPKGPEFVPCTEPFLRPIQASAGRIDLGDKALG